MNGVTSSATRDLRVAVICGGLSNEAAISRISAAGVAEALRTNYKDVTVLELDADLTESLRRFAPDVVFPILHGPPGEDGTIQGFLEILNFPYVGSSVHASAVAMDKPVAKLVFADAGLPLAGQVIVTEDDNLDEAVARVDQQLGVDVVIKPANQGSALGVQFAGNPQEI
ncbi:MAG: D-alanine--D-alanine ligase, partial [Pseudomonadota bacterium]